MKDRPGSKLHFLWLITIIFALLACSFFNSSRDRYGKEFNKERVKMGIPIIPESWVLKDVLGNRITWGYPEYPPSSVPTHPYYSRKQIVVVDENTIEETDYYEGARLVTTLVGDHLYDRLDITCSYHLDDLKNIEYTASFGTGDSFRSINREEAVDILAEWGLPYP